MCEVLRNFWVSENKHAAKMLTIESLKVEEEVCLTHAALWGGFFI
jgi:hypothetical protein